MKVKTYNQKGEDSGEISLSKEVFEITVNSDLIHQVALSQRANRRQLSAKVKDKSEVRGGGRKPWRQKGTGRARHGSIRSPLWKGGGVTFGPTTERNFKKTIPSKMRRKALLMVLSAKAKENLIYVLDELKAEKTKEMAKVFNKLFSNKGSALVLLAEKDDKTFKSIRNIKNVSVIPAKDLNVLDLLSFKYLVMAKDSAKVIKDTFLK